MMQNNFLKSKLQSYLSFTEIDYNIVNFIVILFICHYNFLARQFTIAIKNYFNGLYLSFYT